MRIAHLTTVDISLRFLLLPQLRAVVQAGGEALAISAPGRWVPELTAEGIRHVSLPSSTRRLDPLADLRAISQLWRILRKEQPDVLHTHNPKPGLYGRVLGRLAGVPVVVNTVHGLYVTEADPLGKRILVYLLEAVAARCSDAELVQSPEDLALLTRLRIARPNRTELLGNGVDLKRFDPDRFDAEHRRRVRRELGVGEDQILVGTVGRLVVEKGYLDLLEAAGHLGDDYRVVCVGPHDPEKADALPESVMARARERSVRFLGMRTDVDRLYPAMDIFVLASHREGFPRAAMEAAAMGLPIVATDIRGCRQVVVEGTNGLLVPPHQPLALAEAIFRIGGDPTLREQMGRESARRARSHFDERLVVERVMDAYRRVARRKGLDDLAASLGSSPSREDTDIRPARRADVGALASLHLHGIETGFLSRLGIRFLRVLYRALIESRDGLVLVADDGAGPIGFVAGVTHLNRFYRWFLFRHGLSALLGALPQLMRPAVLKRALETLRYPTKVEAPAELLAIAVAGEARRRGLGIRLGEALLESLEPYGDGPVRVVVGAGNRPALDLYRKLGFATHSTVEVHAGELSEVLVWSR